MTSTDNTPIFQCHLVFIYALCDPVTDAIRYIGKSNDPKQRYYRHIKDTRRGNGTHRCNWIRSLLEKNQRPILRILQEIPDGSWEKSERQWILYFRWCGCDLTNATDGGEGGLISEETKTKISAANRGKSPTAETREKLSVAGRGRKHTPESIKKMSINRRGKKPSAQTKEKMSAAKRGRKLSEGHKNKISAGLTGREVSPETRKKISTANRGQATSRGQKRSTESIERMKLSQQARRRREKESKTNEEA